FLPEKQQTEPTFMLSRDGITFHRYAEAVIPTTAPKDRDGNRSNYMTWGLVKLPGREDEWSVYATEAYYAGPGGRGRRFRYRLDGFVALQAGEKGGEVLTRPLQFEGSKLVLNYLTGSGGSVRVQLQDADGKPLADGNELHGDATSGVVKWKSDA